MSLLFTPWGESRAALLTELFEETLQFEWVTTGEQILPLQQVLSASVPIASPHL